MWLPWYVLSFPDNSGSMANNNVWKKYDLPKNYFFPFSGSIYPTHFSSPRNTNNAPSISGIAFFITINLYFHKETHLKEIK